MNICTRLVVVLGFNLFAVGSRLLAAEPVDAADLEKPPTIKNYEEPVPFRGMAKAHLMGQVTVRIVIGLDGKVEKATVEESNNPWFERPALNAVLEWRYSKTKKDGQPIRVQVKTTVNFKSSEEEEQGLFDIKKNFVHDKLAAELQWDQAPKVIASVFPIYPYEALVAGTSGKAAVDCVIGPQGRIEQAQVSEATAPEFGQALLAMLDGWRFKAATKGGQPCGAWLAVSYEFSPQSGDVPVTNSAEYILEELAQPTPRIYGGKSLDGPLQAVRQQAPEYPLALLKQGTENGEATIDFFIDAKGDAQLPRIVASSATAFGYAAAQAVAAWRFQPPMKDGKPVIAKVRVPIKFTAPRSIPTEAGGAASVSSVYALNELGAQGTMPKLHRGAPLIYPPAMMKARVVGSVTVSYMIDEKGRSKEVKVLQSTRAEFNQAAIKSIEESTYIPAQKDGKPVKTRVSQTIDFDLNKE